MSKTDSIQLDNDLLSLSQSVIPINNVSNLLSNMNIDNSISSVDKIKSRSLRRSSRIRTSRTRSSIKDDQNKEKSISQTRKRKRTYSSQKDKSKEKSIKKIKNQTRKRIKLSTPNNNEFENAKIKTSTPNNNEFEKANAKIKIQRFMTRVDPNKRRAFFLKSICSDAGVCIAFGKENEKIKKHFDGFINIKYIKSPIKRIGGESLNGFVNEITYEREGYVANTILKSSINEFADNLMFEYLVGQYINKQCRIFPCFVETYGWFLYKDEETWETMKSNKNIEDLEILKNMELQSSTFDSQESMKIACTNSKYLSLLIQHIKEAKTLNKMLHNNDFINNDLLYILYQIYMPLSTLSNTFTHYDIHLDNVLIYEPVKGKYIEYVYVMNNGRKITFKSPYIAKIIDYGRSFFKDEQSTNEFINSSENIYNTICQIEECNEKDRKGNIIDKCGHSYGFSSVGPEERPGMFYFISSHIRNISHDLRLLIEMRNFIRTYKMEVLNICTNEYPNKSIPCDILLRKGTNVIYGEGIQNENEKNFGTIENMKTGLPNNIYNVNDAHTVIKQLVINSVQQNNEYYANKESLGTLTIYQNGKDMEFLPNK